MKHRFVVALTTLIVLLTVTSGANAQDLPANVFEHETHRGLFPSCLSCHGGIVDASRTVLPEARTCQLCHDGQVEARVEWAPRSEPRRTNLRFEHGVHTAAVTEDGQDALNCVQCHSQQAAPWLSVAFVVVDQCLNCHENSIAHYDAPDLACGGCHLPLVDAVQLLASDVAAFGAPVSHDEPEFAGAVHGAAAQRPGAEVATSCATCHARDFCLVCHVDAPEQPAIQALGLDSRSLVHDAALMEPATHGTGEFLTSHGNEARASMSSCATCHTQESCITCHVATPDVATSLQVRAPNRGEGAAVERTAPATHQGGYRAQHSSHAASQPATCAGCHAREDCLDCHRADAASSPGGYHASGFLTRHAAAAYARETTCSDCHNDRAFCASCHAGVDLISKRGNLLGSGYHDAKRNFSFGHGQSARQALETCVTCHTERDCLSCHSATSARRFNPHGPGFDAERLRERAPTMCAACHLGPPPGS